MDVGQSPLSRYLADVDVPCPGCGYSLHRLTSDTCPECNQPLTLKVAFADSQTSSLVMTTLGFLAGAGAGVLGSLLILGLCAKFGKPPSHMWFAVFVIPAFMAVVDGTLALLLLRQSGRRWLYRQSKATRVRIGVAGWVLTLVLVAALLLTLR